MILFRLSKLAHGTDLSGIGSKIAGGRWNSPGIALVYTSESRALCTAEIAVHTGLGLLPSDFQLISILIPDDAPILFIDPSSLQPGWRSFPHTSFTQAFGDRFVKENRYLVLKVPSAVVPGDFNYLIHPAHPAMDRVSIVKTEPFEFDERLFRQGNQEG